MIKESDIKRFEDKYTPEPNTGCWIWTAYTYKGYGRFQTTKPTRSELAHRISYMIYVGEIKNNLLVCHKCDNRFCVNPAHLFLGTIKDNNNDRDKKGRHISNPGEKHGCHILKDYQVIEIRKEYVKQYGSISKIAKKFGVSNSTIGLIVTNKTWRHLL